MEDMQKVIADWCGVLYHNLMQIKINKLKLSVSKWQKP